MTHAEIDEETLFARLAALPKGQRSIVALAGAPGSGKSTLAKRFAQRLNIQKPGRAAVLPMDGYHYDDSLLRDLGLLSRKGAPDTYDVAGLAHMLARLHNNTEQRVAVPVFDRDIEIARAGARFIEQSVDIILVEGNYLLVNEAPWTNLRQYFNLRIFIKVPEAVLYARLIDRWQGYNLSAEQIASKLNNNDLLNGRYVIQKSAGADLLLQQAL